MVEFFMPLAVCPRKMFVIPRGIFKKEKRKPLQNRLWLHVAPECVIVYIIHTLFLGNRSLSHQGCTFSCWGIARSVEARSDAFHVYSCLFFFGRRQTLVRDPPCRSAAPLPFLRHFQYWRTYSAQECFPMLSPHGTTVLNVPKWETLLSTTKLHRSRTGSRGCWPPQDVRGSNHCEKKKMKIPTIPEATMEVDRNCRRLPRRPCVL